MTSPLFAIKSVGGNPDEFEMYNGYWNDDSKQVICGNWNHVGVEWSEYRDIPYDSEAYKALHRRDNRLCDIIEKMGWDINWSDQISSCGGCCQAVSQEDLTVQDSDVFCPNCIKEDLDAYIQERTNNPKQAVRSDLCREEDLIIRGFAQLEEQLENGLHAGQSARPEKFFEKHKNNYSTLVFLVERDYNPYTVTFSLWGKNE